MDNLEEIKKQISELQSKVNKLENQEKEKNKRWRAKIEDKYFYVNNDGNFFGCYENGDLMDDYNYKTRNYFKTEEEAKKYADVKLTYYELMNLADELNNGEKIDWNNLNQSKYYIYFDYDGEELTQEICLCCKEIGQIYCLDGDFVEKAIEKIGKDKLTKLLTYERN